MPKYVTARDLFHRTGQNKLPLEIYFREYAEIR